MEDLKKIFDSRKNGKDDFCRESKKMLSDAVEKNMKSVMIGSLAAIEEELGFLWSHNENTELSPEQVIVKQKFQQARTKILDNGNKYIRQSKEELDKYSIVLECYKVVLPVVQ